MFYCDPCATMNGWPETMFKSRGACEICGKSAICNDRPSRYLPNPPKREVPPTPENVSEAATGPGMDTSEYERGWQAGWHAALVWAGLGEPSSEIPPKWKGGPLPWLNG